MSTPSINCDRPDEPEGEGEPTTGIRSDGRVSSLAGRRRRSAGSYLAPKCCWSGRRPRKASRMAIPGPGYSITMRVAAPPSASAAGELTSAVGRAGGVITGFDVVESAAGLMVVDLSANCLSADHAESLTDAVNALPGVLVRKVSDRTFLVHLGGKIEVTSKVPLRNRDDLSRAYTPGVARVCMAIAKNPDDARRLTIKRNTVAVVTDGTAVLGLGNIGPAAALPVMEGKAG